MPTDSIPPAIAEKRRSRLPRFGPREIEIHEPDHEHGVDEWKVQFVASVLCLAFGIAGWIAGQPNLALACFALSYLAGSWFTVAEVWELLRKGSLDIHFLMLAVAAGAAAIGKWGEGATLLFLFSFSGALEHFAMERTQRAIKSLFHAAPKTALVIAPWGAERIVPIEELTPGLRLRVKPGELFPVDAEIAKGETAADESNAARTRAPARGSAARRSRGPCQIGRASCRERV